MVVGSVVFDLVELTSGRVRPATVREARPDHRLASNDGGRTG
jgi:hypothetical protein